MENSFRREEIKEQREEQEHVDIDASFTLCWEEVPLSLRISELYVLEHLAPSSSVTHLLRITATLQIFIYIPYVKGL